MSRASSPHDELLRSYDASVVARGRRYAMEGRVTGVRHEQDRVRAFVHGTQRYEVVLGAGRADCTCPAYARENQCKHLAAVAVALERARAREPPCEPLPEILRQVYSSSIFLERLSLHAGARLGGGVDRWSPLADWWRRSNNGQTPAIVEMRRQVVLQAPQIARDVEALRAWSPPAPSSPGTAFGELHTNLAAKYLARREHVEVRGCAPGPLDGRHPGFELAWDTRRGVFEARERASPLLAVRLRLAFMALAPARTEPRFVDGALGEHGPVDAWELFALREVLRALHARSEHAVASLETELGRPTWDHVLDQLTKRPAKPAEPRQWAFFILPGLYRDEDHRVVAFARRVASDGKAARWKKESFEALYAEDSSPLEREIARVALASLDRPDRGVDARIVLGTPQAHETLRLLAQHPRTHVAAATKPDPERDPRAEIVVGDATMRLERAAPTGALAPRFLVGDKELSAAMLGGGANGAFRAVARGATIVSAFVPPALRPWLAAVEKMGPALAFPAEAVGRLAAATQPLVAAGVAELPRDALGVELPCEPRPALRVEWRPEGAAVVEVFVSVHPSAPLVAPGFGPELFTFEDVGRRVFVERDLARERVVATEARAAIDAPVVWDHAVGRTESLEDALALAAWLDRNPHGFVVEVKIGRPPSVTAWADATHDLTVRREGSWLVLGGALDVAGAKLTVGDVLDAARMARRYVKAADGLFLELSREAIEKLRPVAIATELAEERGVAEPRVHDAFGGVLADARALFPRGIDLEAYTKRFEERGRRARVPPLDHGTLRPYQHDGAAWMLGLATWAPGCILADDMGLGKTVQTAAVLKARAKLGPALIVAPASVASNWMSELARFVPSLAARWFVGAADTPLEALGPRDVLVVSYGLLQRRAEAFAARKWATVVVDEAQYVKNVAAQRTDAVRALERDFTIALTGTPLENHLGELYSIADLAFPSLLGAEPLFRERFRRPIEGQRDATRLAVLGRLLAPFLLRRTREDVLRELPPREEIVEYVDLGPEEAKRYLAMRRACEQQFAKRKKQETAAQLKIALLAALTRLRQLACDVRLVDPTFAGGSAKIARAVEIAVELAQEGNRALVFSQFTQFLGKLRAAFEAAGLRVAYLAGETPTEARGAIVDAFQSGKYDVFCVSLLAGGTGLNLTKASYVIHTDPWWNPAAEEQATSRAHRMGQTDPVTVYKLVARGTIEEAVLAMHAHKKALAAAVLDGKASAKTITSNELLDLLRFGG